MKKGFVFLVTLMVLAAFLLPVSALARVEARSVDGTLTGINGRQIAVRPATGATVVLAVNANTHVFINGAPAKLSDLKVGNHVDVEYAPLKMLARSVSKTN